MKHTYYKSTTSSSPLSAAVKAGETLYLSGQLGISPETGKIVSHDAGEQTVQVLKNMEDVLTQAGYSFEDVVKTMIFVADRGDMPAVNNAYSSVWGEDKPARSAVQVVFPNPAVKVEIEAIAVRQTAD
ncbi:RidA family protein [Enterocloster citroniae]